MTIAQLVQNLNQEPYTFTCPINFKATKHCTLPPIQRNYDLTTNDVFQEHSALP